MWAGIEQSEFNEKVSLLVPISISEEDSEQWERDWIEEGKLQQEKGAQKVLERTGMGYKAIAERPFQKA